MSRRTNLQGQIETIHLMKKIVRDGEKRKVLDDVIETLEGARLIQELALSDEPDVEAISQAIVNVADLPNVSANGS